MTDKILLVDDEPSILDLLGNFMTVLGYNYSTAKDGVLAVEKLKVENFNIVITDIQMPNMDGMQLLNHVAKHYPNIDVIVVTGYGQNYTFFDVIKAGAADYLTKPFTKYELEAKLKRVLREQLFMVLQTNLWVN